MKKITLLLLSAVVAFSQSLPLPKATEAQARAGTDNNTVMTPLRTKQAIEENGGSGIVTSVNGNTGAVTVQPLPTYAPLASTELILNNDGIVNTTTISGPTEFGLASSGGAGSRRHISADFSGTQTVTTDFAVYRNGATASALINEAMSGHQDIVIMDEGAGILRWYDNKFFAKDLQTELIPSNYSPAGTSVKDHLAAIDTALATASGMSVGTYYLWKTANLGSRPANTIIADAAGATNSGVLDMMTGDAPIAPATWIVLGNGTVATPTVDIPAGSYGSTQNLTFSNGTSGAVGYVTQNGVDPTPSDTLISGTVAVSSTATVKARYFKELHEPSAVFSGLYTIASFSYLVSKNLDYGSSGAAVSDGWTNNSGPDWTVAGLAGYSTGLNCYWGESADYSFTPSSDVWVYYIWKPISYTSASNFMTIYDGTGTTQARIKLISSTTLEIGAHATAGAKPTTSYAIGTTYHLKFHIVKGNGTDGAVTLWVSTTGTFGAPAATITTGANALDCSKIRFQASANIESQFQKLRISLTDMGDNPL